MHRNVVQKKRNQRLRKMNIIKQIGMSLHQRLLTHTSGQLKKFDKWKSRNSTQAMIQLCVLVLDYLRKLINKIELWHQVLFCLTS